MPARANAARRGEKSAAGSGRSSAGRSSAGRSAAGRAAPPKRAQQRQQAAGRYTPPIPRTVKRSPRWYPYVLIGLIVIGVATIILDYTEVAPGAPSGGYVVGGIVAILVAALMATRYR